MDSDDFGLSVVRDEEAVRHRQHAMSQRLKDRGDAPEVAGRAGAACREMGSHRVAASGTPMEDVSCNIWLAALKRHDNKYA